VAKSTLKSLFLSYSSENWELALRLRFDLKRAGIDVWTYQSNSEVGVDFRNEYLSAIVDATHFCVIDSPESRASPHVQKECQFAKEQRKPIYVCLAVARNPSSRGEWWINPLPFENFNDIRAVLFSNSNYFSGVREICFALQVHLIPDLTFPGSNEFWQDLCAAELPFRERDKLIDLWWTFVDLYLEDIKLGEAQLRVLLALADRLIKKKPISLLISHGLVLTDMECYEEALREFHSAVTFNPADPRAWVAAAGAEYKLGDYMAALASYSRAERILESENSLQSNINVPALVHNISRTLEALGRNQEAESKLDQLQNLERDEPHVLALTGRLKKGANPHEAIVSLERALAKYNSLQNVPDTALITDLLWCYRKLNKRDQEERLIWWALSNLENLAGMWKEAANFFFDQDKPDVVVRCLEEAISLAPRMIEFHAELSCMHYRMGDVQRASIKLFDYFASQFTKPSEIYFLGLALHLAGASKLADLAYERACADPLVSSWGPYNSLI
jgi:tetratricopeptide (TPR) repeat protein